MGKEVVSQLFNLLEEYGVKHIVCSPGSRNAALLLEAHTHPAIKKHIVVDERSAAFIGFGISMATKTPVVLTCTSGTAMLNYGPALAEAFYQGIPLIVVSADRPAEWIDQDDSQTIRQTGPLDNIAKASYDLNGDWDSEDEIWLANRIFNEGIQKCLSPKQGPVHFNIHLDGKVNNDRQEALKVRKILNIHSSRQVDKEQIKHLVEEATGKKILFVAGFMLPDDRMQKAVACLLRLSNVCVMAETVSNLHLPVECYRIDNVLFSPSPRIDENFKPDIIISVGGALISRKLKEYLRKCDGSSHWAIGYSNNVIDCFKRLSLRIEADPASFIKTFAKLSLRKNSLSPLISTYQDDWRKIRQIQKVKLKSLPWSDLRALDILFNALPRETNLFLSNGTAVRYGQIIPYHVTHATYSNRGVSGIEGCTSTAIGISLVYEKITCLVTGDMSFLYDLGGLASNLASERLIIVILDNGGGDIFRFIKATKDLEIREKYLCAQREVPTFHLAQAFGFDYYFAENEKNLKKIIRDIFEVSGKPKMLHISTRNSKNNSSILRNFLINQDNDEMDNN